MPTYCKSRQKQKQFYLKNNISLSFSTDDVKEFAPKQVLLETDIYNSNFVKKMKISEMEEGISIEFNTDKANKCHFVCVKFYFGAELWLLLQST